MAESPATSDQSYWTMNFHTTNQSPSPPEGVLKIDLCISRTHRRVNQDEHGNPRWSNECRIFQIWAPTLQLPGTMNRDQYFSYAHHWLESFHLNIPLESVVLTYHLMEHIFGNAHLHEKLSIHVSFRLDHVLVEYVTFGITRIDLNVEQMEEEDEDTIRPMKRLCVCFIDKLRDLYAFVASEEHKKMGDCSICLDDLVLEDGDHEKIYLFKSPCGHVFHDECMTNWLRNNDSCPLCRFVVSSRME